MGTARQEGLRYLESTLGWSLPRCVAVSKLFAPEESRTRKETWWFDLPIEKIERLREKDYYLLGKWVERRFVILKVPNQFFLDNMRHFDTRHQQRIWLHLAAYEQNWLIDERCSDRVDFSEREVRWEVITQVHGEPVWALGPPA